MVRFGEVSNVCGLENFSEFLKFSQNLSNFLLKYLEVEYLVYCWNCFELCCRFSHKTLLKLHTFTINTSKEELSKLRSEVRRTVLVWLILFCWNAFISFQLGSSDEPFQTGDLITFVFSACCVFMCLYLTNSLRLLIITFGKQVFNYLMRKAKVSG